MKALFITDTHLTGRGPSSRTDNYVDAIFEKLDEVAAVIKDESIDIVFHGGDLFDKPAVSFQLTGKLAQFIHSTGVPWHVVPGNHDLFGYNLKTLSQTSLGLLYEAGVINLLTREGGPVYLTSPEGVRYSFEGQEYHMDIDKNDASLDYYVTSDAAYKFLIPHSMLLDKNYFPGIPYTRTHDLAGKTDADYIFVGHYHDGFTDAIENNGKYLNILNPGSMTRDEASKGNLKRRPGYVLIGMGVSPTIEYREFLCAKDGVDIFDRSHITAKQNKNRYLDAFEQKLGDAPVAAGDVRTALSDIVKASNGAIDSAVVKEANDRLDEAEQMIGSATQQMNGFIEKPHNLSIARVEIKGFQSHKDSDIPFGPGLTAIVGSSDSGKSSIIRALRFALYNEPRGAEFIRHGSVSASVKVTFSDGSYLERTRTRSSSGSYRIGLPDGTETEIKGFANNMPVDIPNTHQMPRIQLTKDLEATLSIGYQLDQPFLIGESPGTRASIIGKLAGVDLVDGAVREIAKEVLAESKELRRLKEERTAVEESLVEFQDLDETKTRLEEAAQKLKKLQDLQKKRDDAVHLSQASTNNSLQLMNAYDAILKAERVLQYELHVQKILSADQIAKRASSVRAEHGRLTGEIERLRMDTEELTQRLQLLPLVSTMEMLAGKRRTAVSILNSQNDVNDTIAQAKKELASLPTIRTEGLVRALEENLRKKELAVTLIDEDLTNRTQQQHFQQVIAQQKENYQNARREYHRLLEENGTCPTCHQTTAKGELAHVH